jgi:hypothetical protein
MSVFDLNFTAELLIGGQQIPLASEIVISSNASDGVASGFIFKVNREVGDGPVSIYLGDMIDFIEKKLDGGTLASNPGVSDIIQKSFNSTAQPGMAPIDAGNFNSSNQAVINIYEFSINSSSEQFLFSLNLDISDSDPTKGFLPLPADVAKWLKVENLSITFSATKKKGGS